MVYEIKEPGAPATSKQTWAIFKLGGGDVRNQNLTRAEASGMIESLMNEKGIEPGKKSANKTQKFQDIWEAAVAAGRAAGQASNPTPIHVVERQDPFDSTSPIKRDYGIYSEGACGFAWINVKPGTSAFARWLKKEGYARRDSYYGGVTIWISEYNQSMERKEAHAKAMAKVFEEHGIKAYAMSRLD